MLALEYIRCLTMTYLRGHPIEPPHALLPSARSQTETSASILPGRRGDSVRYNIEGVGSYLPWKTKDEATTRSAAFLAITDRDVAPVPPSSYLKTRKESQETNANNANEQTQKANFFGGYFFSQNQTAKASTKQNKTPRKQTSKATITIREKKRKEEEAKLAELRGHECRPSASKEACLIDKE